MEIIAIVVFGVLALFSLVQLVCAIGFARVMGRPRQELPPDEGLPKAAVLLCLRGSDPFLDNCIVGLLSQDYPSFDIRIIVDHRDDPAWEVAEEIVSRHNAGNVQIHELQNRQETCSLVNSSVVQAISELDESYEVVAILDADVVAHPSWLRELVAPLLDPEVVASAGNRWYMPEQATWAALVRYVWNVGSVVQMFWGNYTWGGSVAVNLKLFRESDLLSQWSKAFGFDTTIYAEARRQGYRTAFVPTVMMTNRETVYMPGFVPWMARQMLLSRLYHPHWPQVIGQSVITSIGVVAAVVIIAISLWTQQWAPLWWSLGGLAAYLGSVLIILAMLEAAVSRVVRARNEPVDWFNAGVLLKLLLALPLTQFTYSAAAFIAMFMRRVEWRGISYRIDGPYDIHMLEYRPYQTEKQSKDSLVSL